MTHAHSKASGEPVRPAAVKLCCLISRVRVRLDLEFELGLG